MNTHSVSSPPHALRLVYSLWTWLLIALIVIVWLFGMALVYVVTVPRDPGRYAVGRWFRRAAVISVKVNPLWKFTTSGVVISDPRRPYVAVSNHESLADIFLISHLPWEMKWLSKEAVFEIPLMGWLMRMAGDIPVRRADRRSRAAALEGCRDRLEKKVTVMILPEGTRSTTEDLLPFHDGAFRLAVELGLPILPMAVAGTRDAMPKGSLLFRSARAEVRVLEPVETAHLTQADVPRLKEEIRTLIRQTRDELFREIAGE